MSEYGFEIAPCWRCGSRNVTILSRKTLGPKQITRFWCKCGDCRAENSDLHSTERDAAYGWAQMYCHSIWEASKEERKIGLRCLESVINSK